MTDKISDTEFSRIQKIMFEKVGVSIGPAKRALVVGRLARRLRHHNLQTFSEYLQLVERQGVEGEWQIMMDLLTTHETYFFREPKHFDFLRTHAQQHAAQREEFRVWSAACSSGEEAYSIAMTLENVMPGRDWQVLASDVSRRMVDESEQGIYPHGRVAKVPRELMEKYFLRGVRSQAGKYLVSKDLRRHMEFKQLNLNDPMSMDIGLFNMIFLRNVLIYFNPEQKKQIVNRLVSHLKPGGYLLVGHSETLNGVNAKVSPVAPSIYRREVQVLSQHKAVGE